MKTLTRYTILASTLALAVSTSAKIITVNTADNTDFSAGMTNLVRAINSLADGDTIAFNIPGTGVHEIDTPAGGYPLITKNNVTIDGYTQPGAVPNSNPIHAANNAQIKILLSSTNGNALSMGASIQAFTGHTYSNLGFGNNEMAILGFFRGTNALVRGLAIQSTFSGSDGVNTGDMKSISFCPDSLDVTPSGTGTCANWRVSGCWFGLDPATRQVAFLQDNVTVAIPTICIAAYRTRNDSGDSATSQFASPATIGVAKNSANPRADFNVIITGYGFDSEGHDWRISGNFWNVLPDGMHNFDIVQWNSGAQAGDAYIESGRDNSNLIIGTDGDGVNDADEGNIFGGTQAYIDNGASGTYSGFCVLNMYSQNSYAASGHGTNCVMAGNYFGMAVDGITRFTNAMELVNSWAGGPTNQAATVRFGSDFDGVSDALEANLVYNNYPFDTVYPSPGTFDTRPPTLFDGTGLSGFGGLNAGVRLSYRGNVSVGNSPVPFDFFVGGNNPGANLTAWTNYEAPFLATNASLVPVLSTSNIFPHLQGTYPPGVAPYTTVIIDVYQADLEGWADGKTFAGADYVNSGLANELTDGTTYTNGFAEGRKYLGSFVMPDNSGNINITLPDTVDLGAGAVTVSANYSADPPGTHNGRVHTSNFADPAYVLPGGAESVGLTHVVSDHIVWYDTNAQTAVLGECVPANEAVDNKNWEGYTAVLSDSVFLLTFGEFTTPLLPPLPGTSQGSGAAFTNQNYVVIKQPAAGGAAMLDWSFYGDSQQGTPSAIKGVVDLSRDNGNPPRVAGDMRYGAHTIITMTEGSLGQVSQFESADNRWANNPIYSGINRYVSEQLFTLNGLPASLAQTPVTNAWDYVYGNTHTATAPANSPEVSRTGGRANFLDNGNVVVTLDDKTGYTAPGEVTTFAIIGPQGNIVKGPTLANATDIWDNMCAFRGGFAIRTHNLLHFYDNTGTEAAFSPVDINLSTGLSYDTGRADASRVCADIRSSYVYLAGQSPQNGPTPSGGVASGHVMLSTWDARTGNFVGTVQVDDGTPGLAGNDRVSVAADDLDRVCVAWSFQPNVTIFTNRQVAARVFQLAGGQLTPLTHSFFAFLNHDSNPNSVLGFETYHPSVAMTRRQICISAKGKLNSTNNVAGGPDTAAIAGSSGEAKVYTVLSHPVPVAAPQPAITVVPASGHLNVSWNTDAGLFTVQTTGQLNPPSTAWANFTAGNVAPPVSVPVAATNKFIRLVRSY